MDAGPICLSFVCFIVPWIGFWMGFAASGRNFPFTLVERASNQRRYARAHWVHLGWYYAAVLLCWLVGIYTPLATAALTALLPMTGVGVWLGLWLWRRGRETARQARQGICPICDYDLTGNLSGVCPECGTAVSMKV